MAGVGCAEDEAGAKEGIYQGSCAIMVHEGHNATAGYQCLQTEHTCVSLAGRRAAAFARPACAG